MFTFKEVALRHVALFIFGTAVACQAVAGESDIIYLDCTYEISNDRASFAFDPIAPEISQWYDTRGAYVSQCVGHANPYHACTITPADIEIQWVWKRGGELSVAEVVTIDRINSTIRKLKARGGEESKGKCVKGAKRSIKAAF